MKINFVISYYKLNYIIREFNWQQTFKFEMRTNYSNLMRVKSIDEKPISRQKRNKNQIYNNNDAKNDINVMRGSQRQNSKTKAEYRQYANDYFSKKIKIINKFIDKTADGQIKSCFNGLVREIQRELMLKMQMLEFQKQNKKQKIKQYKDNIVIVKQKQEQIIQEAYHKASAKNMHQTIVYNKENKQYPFNYDIIAMEMSPKSPQLTLTQNKSGTFIQRKQPSSQERISFEVLKQKQDLSSKLFDKIDKIGDLLCISLEQRQQMNIKQLFNRFYSQIQQLKKKESELLSLNIRQKMDDFNKKEQQYKNKQVIQQQKYEIIQINQQKQSLLQQNIRLKLQCNQLQMSTQLQLQHLQRQNLNKLAIHHSTQQQLHQLSHSYQTLQSQFKQLKQLTDTKTEQLSMLKANQNHMRFELQDAKRHNKTLLNIQNQYRKISQQFEILFGQKINLQKQHTQLAKQHNNLKKCYNLNIKTFRKKLKQILNQDIKRIKTMHRSFSMIIQQKIIIINKYIQQIWSIFLEKIKNQKQMKDCGCSTEQNCCILDQDSNQGNGMKVLMDQDIIIDSNKAMNQDEAKDLYKQQRNYLENGFPINAKQQKNTILRQIQIVIFPEIKLDQSSQTQPEYQSQRTVTLPKNQYQHQQNSSTNLNYILQSYINNVKDEILNINQLDNYQSKDFIRQQHTMTEPFNRYCSNDRRIKEIQVQDCQMTSGRDKFHDFMDCEVFNIMMEGEQCIVVPQIYGLKEQIMIYKRQIQQLRKKLDLAQSQRRQEHQIFQFHL